MPELLHSEDVIMDLATGIVGDFAPEGWTVHWNRKVTRTAGMARFTSKRIELAAKILPYWPASEILDTIRHEVAHAAAGGRAGHGPIWQAKCIELGARPDATVSTSKLKLYVPETPRPWLVTCGCPGMEDGKTRRMRGYGCRRCGEPLRWRKVGQPVEAAKTF